MGTNIAISDSGAGPLTRHLLVEVEDGVQSRIDFMNALKMGLRDLERGQLSLGDGLAQMSRGGVDDFCRKHGSL